MLEGDKIMKTFVILFMTIFIMSTAFAQDSIKIAMDDWKFIQKTTQELGTALDDCDTLNVMYEKRMSLFQMEVSDLRMSNILCDSIVVGKTSQLEMRKEQIALLNRKIQKQKVELWITRGGGLLLVAAAILLLK
jgi:hypothetical protein